MIICDLELEKWRELQILSSQSRLLFLVQIVRDLEGNGLYGTLPRECSLLTELKRFLAPRNVIMGNLEDPFHALTELDTLVLTENKLNGTFPGAMLQQNPNLGVFNVGKNSIVGTLPNALVASKLSHLQLQENNFLGTIPQNIGGATRLRKYIRLFYPTKLQYRHMLT